MVKKASIPELRVVFDTNILYTNAASHLAKLEFIEFIKKHSAYPDLKIVWLLPAIVIEERRFQMLKEAQGLMPHLSKLEKLLGMNFGLHASVLEDRVRGAIERDRAANGIGVAALDSSQVNWDELIAAAVNRRVPFELQKEKGFRDAVVVETFIQEVARAPKTAALCRLAFVSGDELAREAVALRTGDRSNVRICEDLNELSGLINTVISSVDEAYVKSIAANAARMFYDFTTKTGLYTSADVYNRVIANYGDEISAQPPGIAVMDNQSITLAPPQFVSKASNLLTWSSLLSISHSLKRLKPAPTLPPIDFGSNSGGQTAPSTPATNKIADLIAKYGTKGPNLIGAEYEEVTIRKLTFEIKWTCRVSQTGKLSIPKLVNITHDPD